MVGCPSARGDVGDAPILSLTSERVVRPHVPSSGTLIHHAGSPASRTTPAHDDLLDVSIARPA